MHACQESLLTEFAAFLAKTIKYPSIEIYLAAVRHLHIRYGFQLNLHKMLRLQLVLRGIKRCHGDQTRVRLPITIHHLKLFSMLLAIPTTQNFDSLLIWATMTLAFFGFLRLGELTCNSKFDPTIHLTLASITFSSAVGAETPEFMTLLIKESKTDPFRLGHTITIGSTMSDICPVKAIKSYLAVRLNAQGPLLVHASGKPLTKQTLINETRKLLIKSGFKASNYAGHSYRIGAATTQPKLNCLRGSSKRWEGGHPTATNDISKHRQPHYRECQPCSPTPVSFNSISLYPKIIIKIQLTKVLAGTIASEQN